MEQMYQYSILVHLKLGWVCHKVNILTLKDLVFTLPYICSRCCLSHGRVTVFPVVPRGGRQPVSKWLETLNRLVKVYNSLLTTAINQQDQWLNRNCLCYIVVFTFNFWAISRRLSGDKLIAHVTWWAATWLPTHCNQSEPQMSCVFLQ